MAIGMMPKRMLEIVWNFLAFETMDEMRVMMLMMMLTRVIMIGKRRLIRAIPSAYELT